MPKIDYQRRYRSQATKLLLLLLYGVTPELLRSGPWVVQVSQAFLYKRFRLSVSRLEHLIANLHMMGYVKEYQKTISRQYVIILALPAASLAEDSAVLGEDLDGADEEEGVSDV